jgi:flavin-dependent dehydrogenase
MGKRVRSVAIVGAGPSGSALAYYLGRAGLQVALYDRKMRPPIVVGESLVPATVPFLRELGIEEEVARYSTYKRGATFILGPDEIRSFRFAEVRGARTRYSYNVPRDLFDASMAGVAERSGARIIRETAKLERVDGSDRIVLAEESLAHAKGVFDGQPDLIVEAGGRARLLPNLLDLPYETGSRKDTALFAHCADVSQLVEGDVHIDKLERGWSWRIPLPDKMSVGLVIDSEFIKKFGASSEEQFDNYLKHDPAIRRWSCTPRRLSPVLKFTAYQLVTTRAVGAGWVLLGDSFGFVDPIFSSGLLMAFDSARELARAILAGGGSRQLAAYEEHVREHLRGWHRTIEHFYDGSLFTLFRVGEVVKKTPWGRLMDRHFRKHIPCVFSGERSTSRYSVWVVDFMCRRGLLGNDPSGLAIQ